MTDVRGNPDCCVIIPMYNESAVISDVVAGLRAHFDRVVCVDDGSRDRSAPAAIQAGAIVVRHPSNLGQGAAIQTGLTFALRSPEVRYLITFDADGQHRVQDSLSMLDRARRSSADVVLGSRFLQGAYGVPRSRRLLLKAGVSFTRLTTGLTLTDAHNGLRVLNRRAAESLRIRMHGMAHASELLDQIGRTGLAYEEFPVTIEYTEYSRAKGQPSINALNIAFDVLLQRLRAAR